MDNQPPIRISPDGHNVAIRNGTSSTHPWRVTNGGHYADHHVNDWLPLRLDEDARDRPRSWSRDLAWRDHEAPLTQKPEPTK